VAFLLDTNILLRLVQKNHPVNLRTRDFLHGLSKLGEHLHIVPQNIYEFWAVSTRPVANNGLGFSVQKAKRAIKHAEDLFSFLPDSQLIFAEWLRLVSKYRVHGINSHDARIVAAMNVHGVENLLTFNVEDFRRYNQREINVVSPMGIKPS
jgi:predicted nucleic acid-binding protein